ncbi:MAG TPA: aminotransferase class IV [Actinomycetota bacterium]|nr:aminotransferase class IV [Actinomycetota bacterium]
MSTIEIDGVAADQGAFERAIAPEGHFTAMQVRDGGARGLDLHLARLRAANRELFDADLDPDHVRALIRHALGEVADASVRVYVHERNPPAIVVTVKPPAEMASPQFLGSQRYQRPNAHLKLVHTEQGRYRELAQREGFDDALLVGRDDLLSETSMANVGFFDTGGVVWPDAPMLRGITMQLLDRTVRTRRTPIPLADVGRFEGAFVSSARGLGVVSRIDDVAIPVAADRLRELTEAYAAILSDPI